MRNNANDPSLRELTMRLRSELAKILYNCVSAVVVGYLIVIWLGKGLTSPRPRIIENFAHFENIRLPIGARTEGELKSFVVRFKDVDDFTRVYVNNRQVTSTDNPERPFQYITWKDNDRDYKARFVVNRANPVDAQVEIRRWLRQGVNWVMVELENSRWGACTMGIQFEANGTQLEGSPYFIPQRQQTGSHLSNAQLLHRLRELSVNTSQEGEFGIIPEYDALCARLIFGFKLH